MSAPEQLDVNLKQQYQRDKAQHAMPDELRRNIVRQAKQKATFPLSSLWRNTQLALCCALLAVFSIILLPNLPSNHTQYYQIVYGSSTEFREVQQHGITDDSRLAVAELKHAVHRQYTAMSEQAVQFHHQIGLLRQQQAQWQISVCDDLLLQIDKSLLAQLDLPYAPEYFAAQQWVEFISDNKGQLLAIKPANTALQCPGA